MHLSTLFFTSALAASAAAQMSLLELLTANNKTLGTLTGMSPSIPPHHLSLNSLFFFLFRNLLASTELQHQPYSQPGLLQNQQALTTSLTNARNITILAPSNDAFTKFLSTPTGQAASNDPGMLTALLQYHVLVGAHPSSGLNTSLYAHSMLTNTTYTNVTNGQVVQLSKMGNKVMAMSGLKEMSMSTTMDVMFTGGVVHVIDKVLTMPMVSLCLSSFSLSHILSRQP